MGGGVLSPTFLNYIYIIKKEKEKKKKEKKGR
jgi:hypothetical protein